MHPLLVTTYGIPYDLDSIMHYGAYAFSYNEQPTIKPRNSSIPLARLGQRRGFSEKDLMHINALYCEGIVSKNNCHTGTLLNFSLCFLHFRGNFHSYVDTMVFLVVLHSDLQWRHTNSDTKL